MKTLGNVVLGGAIIKCSRVFEVDMFLCAITGILFSTLIFDWNYVEL